MADKESPSWLEIFSPPLSYEIQAQTFGEFSSQRRRNITIPAMTSAATSFQLLKNHGKRSSSAVMIDFSSSAAGGGKSHQPLSVMETINLAAKRILQCSNNSTQVGIPSLLNVPFDPSITGLSFHDQKNVELVEYLLSSADRVAHRNYDEATALIDLCDHLSSPTGNPVQRTVHYFARALRERVSGETGGEGNCSNNLLDDNVFRLPSPSILLSVHERFPYFRMQQLATVQPMAESTATARRIHCIDLNIKSGLHWPGFMQALEARPDHCKLDMLKVTALCVGPVEPVEATGEWLTDFARSKKVNFCFKIVRVDDITELDEKMFGVEEKEAVLVYSELSFATMLGKPDRMEALMAAVRRLNPQLMVVSEMEGNHNARHFGTRFVETLFHHGAVFDSVEACLGREDDVSRRAMEGGMMGRMIGNVVACEGPERVIRGVRLGVWRAFFKRFEMVEKRLSSMTWQQVRLVHETASNGGFCTVARDGKGMLIGWKGTPMMSVTAWNFFRSARLVRGRKHLRVEFESEFLLHSAVASFRRSRAQPSQRRRELLSVSS
ncbi:DELLA protein DWARF8, partial [Linum grandiflorum]